MLLRLDCFLLANSLAHFKGELVGLWISIDNHMISMQRFAVENSQRQRILDQLLDRPLQRPRSEAWIEAFAEDPVFRRIRQLERNLAIGQQSSQILQPQLDNLHQLLLTQRTEDDDVVHAVQELRPE